MDSLPMSSYDGAATLIKQLQKAGEANLAKRGFLHDEDFLFATRHDTGSKVVLERKFPENGGYQEGVDLLNMLRCNYCCPNQNLKRWGSS